MEEEIVLQDTQYHLSDLREFTEYTFWVSAFNRSVFMIKVFQFLQIYRENVNYSFRYRFS